jgi:hypothetical protein
MSKQLTAALAGSFVGVFLAASAVTAQGERFTCAPSEIAVSAPKLQIRCPTSPTPGITDFAIPTATSSSYWYLEGRADRFLDVALATLDRPEPSLEFRYHSSDLVNGPNFDCATDHCRPAEAAFLRRQLRTWVGLGPDGAVARAILPGAGSDCPNLVVDGTPHPMVERTAPASCFPVTVCEAAIPYGAVSATVSSRFGDAALPLPPSEIQTIAIIGDTGCRLKADHSCPATADGCRADCTAAASLIQDCNDPDAWPFATIASTIAKSRPDLVVHVGDYSYREARCPPGDARCAGSPWGDNWPSWRADFFDPAAPLLAAAPWVFVRGNHEDCTRSNKGWFYFLDPGPPPAQCHDNPDPYRVLLPGLQLLVLNTSNAGAPGLSPSHYAGAFTTVNQRASEATVPSWLLSHHPLWAVLEQDGVLKSYMDVLQNGLKMIAGHLDARIRFTVAGHIHLFELLDFEQLDPPYRPPGGVFGMSGTSPDPFGAHQVEGSNIDGVKVRKSVVRPRFGYALAERDGSADHWKLTAYDPKGQVIVACRIDFLSLTCS